MPHKHYFSHIPDYFNGFCSRKFGKIRSNMPTLLSGNTNECVELFGTVPFVMVRLFYYNHYYTQLSQNLMWLSNYDLSTIINIYTWHIFSKLAWNITILLIVWPVKMIKSQPIIVNLNQCSNKSYIYFLGKLGLKLHIWKPWIFGLYYATSLYFSVF